MKKKGIINNILSLMSGKLVSQFISVFITIYLARELEPANFGVLNFATVLVSYFTLVSVFGLTTLGIRNLNHKRIELFDEINKIVSIRIILSVVTFILLIFVVLIIEIDKTTKALILILGPSIILESVNFNWVFNGLQDMRYIAKATVIRTLGYGLILVFLFKFSSIEDIYLVGLATLAGLLIMVLYLLWAFKHKYKYKFQFEVNAITVKKMLSQSSFFLFSGIFANLNTNIDTVMLGFLRSNIEVGIYSSAYRIIGLFSLFIGFIYIPIYPKLVECFSKGLYGELEKILNHLRKFVYLITLPIFVGGSLISKEIMDTLFGSKYVQGYFVFSILLLFTLIFSIREIYGYGLVAWNNEKKYTKIVGFSSMFNIISNFLLIPLYGISAAAINTVLSEIINLVFMKHMSDKIIKIKLDKSYFAKVTLASVMMGIIILIVKHFTSNIIIIVPIGVISYAILVLCFRIFDSVNVKDFLSRNDVND